MKSEIVIGFRPEKEIGETFIKLVVDLGVDKTLLAERAFRKGLAQAAEEIRREKLNEAEAALKRLKVKRNLPPFNAPHNDWSLGSVFCPA